MPNDYLTDPSLGARKASAPNFADQQRQQPKRNDSYATPANQKPSGPTFAAEVVNGSPQVGTGTKVP